MGDLARDKQFYLFFKNGQLQINLKKGLLGDLVWYIGYLQKTSHISAEALPNESSSKWN